MNLFWRALKLLKYHEVTWSDCWLCYIMLTFLKSLEDFVIAALVHRHGPKDSRSPSPKNKKAEEFGKTSCWMSESLDVFRQKFRKWGLWCWHHEDHWWWCCIYSGFGAWGLWEETFCIDIKDQCRKAPVLKLQYPSKRWWNGALKMGWRQGFWHHIWPQCFCRVSFGFPGCLTALWHFLATF